MVPSLAAYTQQAEFRREGIIYNNRYTPDKLTVIANTKCAFLSGRIPDLCAATGKAQSSVEMRYEYQNLWLTQKMMATHYDVSVPAVSQHLKRIYADNELGRAATLKQY
jgi:hypothetical protein